MGFPLRIGGSTQTSMDAEVRDSRITLRQSKLTVPGDCDQAGRETALMASRRKNPEVRLIIAIIMSERLHIHTRAHTINNPALLSSVTLILVSYMNHSVSLIVERILRLL